MVPPEPKKRPTFDAVYGRTIVCECGRIHPIDPRRIIYEAGALGRLNAVLDGYAKGRRVTALMDVRTGSVAGREAAKKLADNGWEVTEIIIPDPAEGLSPVCDDRTHDRLSAQIPETDIILPVGSGVISDLGKWIAYDRDLPYVCVATAATMNGYSSANIAATVKGVKILLRARPPKAVLSDPALLLDAPYELTSAGFGDVLAKSVSSADWRLNHILFGDYFCHRAAALITEIEPLYMNRPEDLQKREPEIMEALFHGLLLTGVAMTMAETSAPASGGEHLISHTLDMMSDLDGTLHDLHGRQVGLGTILASEIYRRVLETESPDFSHEAMAIDRPFWGKLSDEVDSRYAGKRAKLGQAVELLSRNHAWDQLREEVKPFLRSPEEIRSRLQKAGAAFRAGDIGCSKDRLLNALRHAHEIRSRFTVLDLARLAGILPGAAAEIIEAWS